VHQSQRETGWMPIGRPIANTQVYVLDAHLQPVPIGVSGELYIGGDGLARGYLNQTELTNERFIANPFRPGQRLYRTGDLVRYLPDGNIEYLGRIDDQVKVRGFRIELGEIRAVLGQHPAVQEAVVIAREDQLGEKRLVAYLTARQQLAPSVNDLRIFLKERLPDYMLPSAFMFMDALPMLPNGKVNRRALPVPDSLRPDLQAAYVPPQTEVEQAIAAIWKEVLHLEQVGIRDNFFDLGGHSLLIMQVHGKLSHVTDKNISVADMFRYPTIDALAKWLSQAQNEPSSLQNLRSRAEKQKEAVSRQGQIRKESRRLV
jgi:acyl carrier protein